MQLTARVCSYERLNLERVSARAFIAIGGAFWAIAAFGANYFYSGTGVVEALGSALVPLVVALAALAVGWFYERVAAIGLAAGSVAIVVWGLIAGWEMGSWIGVGMLVLVEMIAAAVLFWLAANMQSVCAEGPVTG